MSRVLTCAVCLLLGFWAGVWAHSNTWYLCLPWLGDGYARRLQIGPYRRLDRRAHAQ